MIKNDKLKLLNHIFALMLFKNKSDINKASPFPNWDYSALKKLNLSSKPSAFIFTKNQVDFQFLSFNQLNLDSGIAFFNAGLESDFIKCDNFFIKCFNDDVRAVHRPYCYYIEPEIYLGENGEMSLPPIFCCAEVIKNESLTHEKPDFSSCKASWWQSHMGLPSQDILDILTDDDKAWAHPSAFTHMS